MTWSWWDHNWRDLNYGDQSWRNPYFNHVDHKNETPLPEICETPVETGGGFDAYVDQMLMCSVVKYQRDLTEKLS